MGGVARVLMSSNAVVQVSEQQRLEEEARREALRYKEVGAQTMEGFLGHLKKQFARLFKPE